MAGIFNSDLTVISLADTTTGWSGTSGGLDTQVYKQAVTIGTDGSFTYQTGKNGIETCTFTPATNIDMTVLYTIPHIYWTMRCDVFPFCELLNTGATNSGLMIRVDDGAGNFVQWHVTGSDFWDGSWRNFVLDLTNTTNIHSSSGVLSLADVALFSFITDNSNSGTIRIIDNTWIDSFRFGDGLRGRTTDVITPISFQDMADYDSLTENYYGVVQDYNGVLFAQGRLLFGAVGSPLYFHSVGETVYFIDNIISDSQYSLEITDTFSINDITIIESLVCKTIGNTGAECFLFGPHLIVNSSSFSNMGSIIFQAGIDGGVITGNIVSDSGTTLIKQIEVRNTTWLSSDTVTATASQNVTLNDSKFDSSIGLSALSVDDLEIITDCTFTSSGIGHAVELTSLGTGTMNWNNYVSGYSNLLSSWAYTTPNPSGVISNRFGHSIDISDDDAYYIIGSPEDDINGTNSGRAYIYLGIDGSLSQTLTNPGGTPASDEFGTSVSVSETYSVVGAPYDATDGIDSGRAYIYLNSTGVLQHTLTNPSASPIDGKFGFSVHITETYTIVGAYGDTIDGIDSGRAYIYLNSTGALQHTLTNPATVKANCEFGYSVSINELNCVVGAPFDDTDGVDAGGAYTYTNSTGIILSTLVNSNPGTKAGDRFGWCVDMSDLLVAIGAPGTEYIGGGGFGGMVHSYDILTGLVKYNVMAPQDPYLSFGFADSLAICNEFLVIGDPGWSDDDISGKGIIRIYEATTGTLYDTTSNPANTSAQFGYAVGVSNGFIASGIPEHSSALGGAYVYSMPNRNDSALYVPLTTGTLIVNVGTGYDIPTVKSDGAIVTVLAGQVTTTITVKNQQGDPIVGARVYAITESTVDHPTPPLADDTLIFNTLTDVNGQVTDIRSLASSQPITGWARDSTSPAPYYKQTPLAEVIDNAIGLNLNMLLILDE